MLQAIMSDLSALPDLHVVTSIDHRLVETFSNLGSAGCPHVVDNAATEQELFDELVAGCDVSLIIAPETDRILSRRVQRVIDLGGTPINCAPPTVDLCGDKLAMSGHLMNHGIETIPTCSVTLEEQEPWSKVGGACVIKPRDGAGSWLTFGLVENDFESWRSAKSQIEQEGAATRMIVQPWIRGRSISVAGICHTTGSIELFPIGSQSIEGSRFCYRGGIIPADLDSQVVETVYQMAHQTLASIPGLRGYVGIDLLLPESTPKSPRIVEINPRLTTSYLGYRRLCFDNIAGRLLAPVSGNQRLLCWKPQSVSFGPGDPVEFHGRPDIQASSGICSP